MICTICLLLLLAPPLTTAAVQNSPKASNDGFTPLFNGKDLSGWKQFDGKPGLWVVENGMIVCKANGGGWLGTEKEYANFELRLEYQLKPGGNSGVYIRAPEKGYISRQGMEIQILDDDHPSYKGLKDYQYTGSIYHVVGPSRRVTKPGGEWNAMTIRADGKHIQVWVNGTRVVDADLDDYLRNPAVAKEHTGLARKTGHIGLQSHTDRVEFRNVQLKELR
jgi:hypothetical protein